MRFIAPVLLMICSLRAAVPVCPAGMPLGNVNLSVQRATSAPALPWRDINRLEEGDRILYSPVLRPKEKRNGKVSMVVIASVPQADNEHGFEVLEPKDADQPAEWKVPFRSSLAVFVYAPSGLSTRKLRGLVARDQDLVSQLADYAEKTEQTENLLHALSSYETTGASDNLQAALSGFSSQYGLSNKLDRSAPLEQQTMSVFRSLNPALSAYDPISPSGSQRFSQTAGLATAVAGMFLGSSVGLAAGGTAMALNLKTLMFPNTEFRSSYVQTAPSGVVSVCGKREASQGRTRLAYMWARRLADTKAPELKIDGPNNLPRGLKSPVRVAMPEAQWNLVSRVREWYLKPEDGKIVQVGVQPIADSRNVEIDLSKANVPPGKYRLEGRWDWDEFTAGGEIVVRDLPSMSKVHPEPESQNRLRQRNGKQIVQLQGSDFQFVEKVQLAARGDKYGKPVDVPFSLPSGLRAGPQSKIELQVDTSPLMAGEYSLLFFQPDGKARTADLTILADPPAIENLPIIVHEGETETTVGLRGRDLDKISSITADGVQFEVPKPGELVIRTAALERGSTRDVRLNVKGYAAPIVLANALLVAAPRPKVVKADVVLPGESQITLREKELPAGSYLSAMLQVERAGTAPSARLACADGAGKTVKVAAGAQADGARLQVVQNDRLFLSFDPGTWPAQCLLTVAVENESRSKPVELGRVVRMPRITGFRLTDEAAGDAQFYGVITGQDLELIERTGWAADNGVAVSDLPAVTASDAQNQTLRVKMPWPSPSPKAPLFLWLHGEDQGRATTVRP